MESTPEAALKAAQELDPCITAADLHQDEDVLDTWFSSGRGPSAVVDPQMPGHPDHTPTADVAY